jgi:hypothetical protein
MRPGEDIEHGEFDRKEQAAEEILIVYTKQCIASERSSRMLDDR